MVEYDPALVERMVALVRDLGNEPYGGEVWDRSDKFKAYAMRAAKVAAELPVPVDPDLWLARDELLRLVPWSDFAKEGIIRGDWDGLPAIRVAVEVAKRIRQQEAK